jgi:spermidine/putrescine-binding protein
MAAVNLLTRTRVNPRRIEVSRTRIQVSRVALIGIALWFGMSGALAADRAKVLNIYAWPEYFPQSLIAQFQAGTGIHINSTVLDSPDTAETILSVGHSDYDLVTMNASPQLAREIPRGFWKKLDLAAIPILW